MEEAAVSQSAGRGRQQGRAVQAGVSIGIKKADPLA
jgi:hypothetical protein